MFTLIYVVFKLIKILASLQLVKCVLFYLERFQRYGVLKNVQLFGPPCIYCLLLHLTGEAAKSHVVPRAAAVTMTMT